MTPIIIWAGVILGLAAGAFFAWYWLRRQQTLNPSSTESIPHPGEARPVPEKSAPEKGRVPMALQGTLSQVPVHDFLQFLAQGGRTGTLIVVSGRRHGYARMQTGQILFASFRGRHGLVALHAMLALTEGDYEFIEGGDNNLPDQVEAGPPQTPMDVVEVLLQWEAKRNSEQAK